MAVPAVLLMLLQIMRYARRGYEDEERRERRREEDQQEDADEARWGSLLDVRGVVPQLSDYGSEENDGEDVPELVAEEAPAASSSDGFPTPPMPAGGAVRGAAAPLTFARSGSTTLTGGDA